MYKNFILIFIFFLIIIFFYIVSIEYFSEENKQKINKNRQNINQMLIDNKKNLLILKNDTLNVIHFNSDINKKDRTKRKFWDLIKVK
jgi:uncharacterized membrane protein|tara:strand:- start:4755 stop:5015 length:261 start_codon:yes stop_codon:yes gene_type:complete